MPLTYKSFGTTMNEHIDHNGIMIKAQTSNLLKKLILSCLSTKLMLNESKGWCLQTRDLDVSMISNMVGIY